MGESIVVTSGKGGVGKTTTTANLGAALALQGKKICLIDMDIGLRNLDVVLGLENRIIYDIGDVVEGRCKIHQALIKDKRFKDLLYLLPASQTMDKSAINRAQMRELIKQLKSQFDYILVDSPAGIEEGYKNAVAGADQAIVVTTPEISAVRDADRIIGLLEKEDIAPPKLIINRIRPQMMKEGDVMNVDEITTHLSIKLLGIITENNEVIRSSNSGDPVVMHPNNQASQGYRNIARRILGEPIPLMAIEPQKDGFLTRLKQLFSKK